MQSSTAVVKLKKESQNMKFESILKQFTNENFFYNMVPLNPSIVSTAGMHSLDTLV